MKRIKECELCGSKNAIRRTKIDNAILTTCDECVKFGQELPKVEIRPISKILPKLELGESVVPNFHLIIRKERTKRNLTQDDFAKKLNEKSSVIKRIEEGWEPSDSVIKKMEKFFNIKLTEEIKEERLDKKSERSELTIGDVVEVD